MLVVFLVYKFALGFWGSVSDRYSWLEVELC